MDFQNNSELWDLCFSKQSRQSSHRAAELRQEEIPVQFEHPKQFQKIETSVTKEVFNGGQLPEENPEHLVRFVMLVAGLDVNAVFQFLVGHVQMQLKNFKICEDSFALVGFVFDETVYAQFRVQLFAHGKQVGICIHVLDGSAQDAVTEFWRNLKIALIESEYVEAEMQNEFLELEDQSDEEDDFFASWDDDSEEIPSLTFSQPSLLQPCYVNDLVEDLQDQNFMLHSLLLLAWNCQLQQNLEIISNAGQAQQLFDAIITCLVTTAADFCLPIARSASLLVTRLVETQAITISEEQFNVLVRTIVQWTIQNQKGEPEKITQSEEIAQLLSSKLPQLAQVASSSDALKQLQEVYSQVPFQSVRQNIKPLVEAY